MKKSKNKAYEQLNKKLGIYLENSTKDVHIDEEAKDNIWKNLSKEIHEKEMKRKYRNRKAFKVAVTVCVVVVALVSVDLSSNASLFRRLLTSVSGNTIQSMTRDSEAYKENRDEELDAKVKEINEQNNMKFISPILPEDHEFVSITFKGNIIIITFIDDYNNRLRIIEKNVDYCDIATSATYSQNQYNIESFNNNGIDYNMLKSGIYNVGIFVKEYIEYEVIGIEYTKVLETTLRLQK